MSYVDWEKTEISQSFEHEVEETPPPTLPEEEGNLWKILHRRGGKPNVYSLPFGEETV
jgi:hypothetical protein